MIRATAILRFMGNKLVRAPQLIATVDDNTFTAKHDCIA